MNRPLALLRAAAQLLGGLWVAQAASAAPPNVVLILLDDVGFSDASTFGGPVQTPELDRLAAEGLRYNCFHTAAMCSPTRASLLTGRNHHRVGFGYLADFPIGHPGYDGRWKKSTASIAQILRLHGYSTAAFGKWHNTPTAEILPTGPFDRWPTSLGFEYFYGFLGWSTSQWEPALYRNTLPVEPPRDPHYHLTVDLANDAIRWVRTHESLAPERPYFLYFATGAAHAPHQTPQAWIDRYRGRFDQGWDVLRRQSFARQKRLGVIPADAELTPRPVELPSWDSIPAAEKPLLARQMEVYAGFLAQTDHEVGRLLRVIREGPGADNTLIFYIVGDNGSAGEGGVEGKMDGTGDGQYGAPRPLAERLKRMNELGGPGLDNLYSGCWAWAGTTPFQWFKSIASHLGGTRNPLVVSWPRRIPDKGGLRPQFTHVNDIAATICDAAGIALPSAIDGVGQQPFDGVSFLPTLAGASVQGRHRTQYFEMIGNRAIYQDGWVAAARHSEPYRKVGVDCSADRWELYDLTRDYSEAHDIAALHPEKLRELQAVFDREARANGVYPLMAYANRGAAAEPRKRYVFHAGIPRVETKALRLFTASYRISAVVDIPDGGAQGVIMSYGGRWGGFDLYLQNDQVVFENVFANRVRQTIRSASPVPRGRVAIAFEFVGAPIGGNPRALEGAGTLYCNGARVGTAVLDSYPDRYYGSMGIGEGFASSPSQAFTPPFRFTGAMDEVDVDSQ